MEEKTTLLDRLPNNLQEYISLGYLYLIVLGIISDVIFYKYLGINILNYAGISDILLTPINTLVYDMRVLVLVIVFVALGYFLLYKGILAFHVKNRTKRWYQKMVPDMEAADKKYSQQSAKNRIEFILFFFTAMFIGLKIGSGSMIQKKIANGELKTSHEITFSDGIIKKVRVIGQNSSYIFYVPDGHKEISITPISGNIKEIKQIKTADAVQ